MSTHPLHAFYLHLQNQNDMQKEKAEKVRQEREELPDITEELRTKFRQHREKFEAAREPLLEGLASKYDLDLFKEAQARACEQLVNIIQNKTTDC